MALICSIQKVNGQRKKRINAAKDPKFGIKLWIAASKIHMRVSLYFYTTQWWLHDDVVMAFSA